jgi:hypothetical protein
MLRNVANPIACYYHVFSSLSQDIVCLVRHVLHEKTGPDSYANLRTSLLASHSLFNYQKMERMMRLSPMGDRKLSVMLAEMLEKMLEYCPAGESTTAVFAYFLLQQLLREICVLLSEDDQTDVDKADHLIAMQMPHLTTPYHPQSNGAMERFHCRLKDVYGHG